MRIFSVILAVVLLSSLAGATHAVGHACTPSPAENACIGQLYTSTLASGNTPDGAIRFTGSFSEELLGAGTSTSFKLFFPPPSALESPPFDLSCQNCWSQSGGSISFTPSAPGANELKVCKIEECTGDTSELWCENGAGISCSFSFPSCTSLPNNPFWLYAKGAEGERSIFGGSFSIRRELGCVCSSDDQCIGGLCLDGASICTAQTPPILYFE